MIAIDQIRAETLSAPKCSFLIDDPVFCREGPMGHEFSARVVSRTFCACPVYDVETPNGDRINGITILRLDESRLEKDAK